MMSWGARRRAASAACFSASASASACAALAAATLSASAFLAAASFSYTSRAFRSRASRRSAAGSIRRVLEETFAVPTTEAEVDRSRESGALLRRKIKKIKKEVQKESTN